MVEGIGKGIHFNLESVRKENQNKRMARKMKFQNSEETSSQGSKDSNELSTRQKKNQRKETLSDSLSVVSE
jgi:hypothetical protein